MKKTSTITLLILVFILGSCSNDKSRSKSNDEGIEFIIQGTALNGDGKKLGLYIPSLGMENRLTSEIILGKFYFKGKLENAERVQLAFEEELEARDGAYASYDVFLTQDTISISFIVDQNEDFNSLYFAEKSFEDNGINSYSNATINEFYSVLYNSNSENLAELRTNIIAKNKELYSQKEHTIIGLFNLRLMFENKPLFELNELTENHKKNITIYFENIDTSLVKSPDYTVVKSYINIMNNNGYANKFMDFSLVDKDNLNVKLSNVISKNKYTVLDFWWSGCIPCRKFNRESREYYADLKEKGIEIISINVDKGIERWKKASEKDQIEWINLYAGANSKIEIDYNIVAFPTTLIFDKNQNLVEFDFHKALELLELK